MTAAGTWNTDPAESTVVAPDPTVTEGPQLTVSTEYLWGVTAAGVPYYNALGVAAGDEAVLVLDNTTGRHSLRPMEV